MLMRNRKHAEQNDLMPSDEYALKPYPEISTELEGNEIEYAGMAALLFQRETINHEV